MIVLGPHAHEGADVERHGSFFQTLFEAAGVWAPLTLGVIAIALVVNIVVLARAMNRRVNGVALGQQLKKLIDAGNAERAVKLCHAAEGAVATQIALVGLNARQRNENAYSAMQDARAGLVGGMRKAYNVALAFGIAGLVETAVMLAAAAAKGFSTDEIGAIAVLPAVLGFAVVMNAMLWNAMKRDVDFVIGAVS